MALQGHDDELLKQSLNRAEEYPSNLVRTEAFPHVLSAYRSKLDADVTQVFQPEKSNVVIWDLAKSGDASYTQTASNDLDTLRSALGDADPLRRFIFLRSSTSRKPLKCSKGQMVLLLSHHQIMASFLDFIMTFRNREQPHCFASLCFEDYLGQHHKQPGLLDMGRSGIRIQHCFNILGVEYDCGDWQQRQTAAYHSFDLVNGRALWVVLKGNLTIQKRFKEATEASLQRNPDSLTGIGQCFGQALTDHLLLLQWSAESWASYAEHCGTECRPFSDITKSAPIQALADRIPTLRKDDRTISFRQQSRRGTGLSESPVPTLFRSWSCRIGAKRTNSGSQAEDMEQQAAAKKLPPKLGELVNFDKLQKLSRLDTKLDTAVIIIGQNMRVLSDIRAYYKDLVASAAFCSHISEQADLEVCKQHSADFARQVSRLEGDLDNYQGHFKSLLRGVEQATTTFGAILQLENMRTAEYFAKSGEDSALLMQSYTEQMHVKTISMHVITVLTLIFLPGTLVATVFSSGILTFGEDGTAGFGPNLGDWEVRLGGLKLYFAVSVPLMVITLSAWIFAYYRSRTRVTDPELAHALSDEQLLRDGSEKG